MREDGIVAPVPESEAVRLARDVYGLEVEARARPGEYDHNVLKLRPPLVFTEEDADLFLATLGETLEEDAAQPRPIGPP